MEMGQKGLNLPVRYLGELLDHVAYPDADRWPARVHQNQVAGVIRMSARKWGEKLRDERHVGRPLV